METNFTQLMYKASKNIFLVEDKVSTAMDIRSRLNALSYKVSSITEICDETIQKAIDFQPDLILIDSLSQTDKSEVETIDQIQTLLDIPVLYISDNTKEFSVSKRLSSGIFGILQDNIQDTELSNNIEMALYKHSMEKRLKESKKWLSTTLNSIGEGVIAADYDGYITFINPTAEKLTGWTKEEAENQFFADVFNARYEDTGEKLFTSKNTWIYDEEDRSADTIILRTKNHRMIAIEKNLSPITDDRGEDIGLVITFRDITEKKGMEKQLHKMAVTDKLTGLYNRTGFFTLAEQQLFIAEREMKSLCLVYIDLDGMKYINDTFGHKEGDKAIISTAKILKKTFRDSDIIARIGGDEFVVLASVDLSNDQDIIIKRLNNYIDRHNKTIQLNYSLVMSTGIATYSHDNPIELDDLLHEADLVMYKNKQKKRRSLENELSVNIPRIHKKQKIVSKLHEAITAKNIETAQIMTLINASTMINSSLNINEIKEKTIEAAMSLVGAEAASLLFLDDDKNELIFEITCGDKGEEIKTKRIQIGQGIAGWVAENNQPVIVNNPKKDSRFYTGIDKETSFTTLNVICLPIIAKGKLFGVLEVINKTKSNFNETDLDLLTTLTNHIAVAIDNSKLYNELENTFYCIISALAETIDKKDPYTGGHAQRVKEYSVATGKYLDLSEHEQTTLELSSILHDVGKVGISDDILRKPEGLTREEFNEMKTHTLVGEDIIRHVPSLQHIIPGIKHHHERFDGRGYPDGLKGDEIDLIARIIAVNDAFDAMTTNRSYRDKLNIDKALKELKQNSGTQFDPEIIDAFFKAYNDGMII